MPTPQYTALSDWQLSILKDKQITEPASQTSPWIPIHSSFRLTILNSKSDNIQLTRITHKPLRKMEAANSPFSSPIKLTNKKYKIIMNLQLHRRHELPNQWPLIDCVCDNCKAAPNISRRCCAVILCKTDDSDGLKWIKLSAINKQLCF